jgi:hypothetical protein
MGSILWLPYRFQVAASDMPEPAGTSVTEQNPMAALPGDAAPEALR